MLEGLVSDKKLGRTLLGLEVEKNLARTRSLEELGSDEKFGEGRFRRRILGTGLIVLVHI